MVYIFILLISLMIFLEYNTLMISYLQLLLYKKKQSLLHDL